MKRVLSTIIIASMLCMSCSTWMDNFKKDPVAQVQTVITTLQSAINIATLIFGQAYTLLPEAKKADAKRRFDHAVMMVEHSKRTLRDALATAQATSASNPNLVEAFQKAIATADDLRALVREIQMLVKDQAAAGTFAYPSTQPDELDMAVDDLKRSR